MTVGNAPYIHADYIHPVLTLANKFLSACGSFALTTLFSAVLPKCLEFPIKTTGDVSVDCMLSFSYEDSINVYSFIVQVAYQFAYGL